MWTARPPDFSLIPVGLSNGDDPFFRLESICNDCGTVVVDREYDVRRDVDADIKGHGAFDGMACMAHWEAFHAL